MSFWEWNDLNDSNLTTKGLNKDSLKVSRDMASIYYVQERSTWEGHGEKSSAKNNCMLKFQIGVVLLKQKHSPSRIIPHASERKRTKGLSYVMILSMEKKNQDHTWNFKFQEIIHGTKPSRTPSFMCESKKVKTMENGQFCWVLEQRNYWPVGQQAMQFIHCTFPYIKLHLLCKKGWRFANPSGEMCHGV